MIATCRARDRLAQSVAPVPPPAATGGVSEGFGDRTERLEAARTAATGLGMGAIAKLAKPLNVESVHAPHFRQDFKCH